MTIDATNDVSAAMRVIAATPVDEAGAFHGIGFFRDTTQQVTIIHDGKATTLRNGAAAAELVWLNLHAAQR